MSSVAAFISPHGYGHAARCSAILAALQERHPSLAVHLYTLVPEWFFEDSLQEGFHYHSLRTDVGLVQRSPVQEDLAATIEALDNFLPFDEVLVGRLAKDLDDADTRLVLCDIAPLGIAVARAALRPSILIENFTWDWIYQGYQRRPTAIEPHIEHMATLFAEADHRIQTRPVCQPQPASLTTSPVCRKPRLAGESIRRLLNIPQGEPAVLLTMGGIPGSYDFLDLVADNKLFFTIAPGTCDQGIERQGRLIRLPHRSNFYHPDLVAAVDVVVGKLGYSTVAEAFSGGKAFAWVGRPEFRESPVLARFVTEQLPSLELSQDDFVTGGWIDKAQALSEQATPRPRQANGADEAAKYLSMILG